MILLAIINFTFLFGLSNCQYDYDSFESVEVAAPDYIADTIEQSIADTEDYLYDSAPEVDSGSTLQAARRIYFRPKGSFQLGPIPGHNANDVHSRARQYGAYHLCPGSSSMACDSQGRRVQLYARRTLVTPSGRKGIRRNAFRQQTLPTPQKLFLDPVAFGKAGVDTAIQAQNAQAGKFSSPGFTATNFATNDPNNNKPVQTGYTPASTRPLNRGTVTGSNSWFNWRGTGKGNRPLSWSTLTNFRRSFVTPRRRAFRTIRSGYF